MKTTTQVTMTWLTLLLSTTVWSQNLVQNGDFNQNIDHWDNTYGLISWVSDDGSAAIGSLEISDNFNNGGLANAAHLNIIEVQQGEYYKLSAAVKVMADTEAQDAAFILKWLDENERHVGYTDYLYSDTDTADGTWHNINESFTPPEDMHFVQILVAVRGSSAGSTDYATARFDDVRFSLADATGFQVVAGHSGSWYNPQQSGHGLNIEILDNNQMLVFWYVYDHFGNPIWLFANGGYADDGATLNANFADGAMFPPQFNADDVDLTPWGQFVIKFTGCHTGEFKWIPINVNSYTTGEMTISRLTQLKGQSCSE